MNHPRSGPSVIVLNGSVRFDMHTLLLLAVRDRSITYWCRIHHTSRDFVGRIDQLNKKQNVHERNYVTRVCPPEVARSIRRPRPNLMKLSGFVELVSLIILVTTFLKFDRFFTEIQVKNCRSISGIFAIFCRKTTFSPTEKQVKLHH